MSSSPGPTAPANPRSSMLRVLAGGVIISFSPVLFKISGASPSAASLGRTTIGGLFLLLIALLRKEKPLAGLRAPGAVRLFLVCGVLFTLDLEFWHLSIPLVGPGLATILANFQVLFLAVLGVVLYGERFTWKMALSIVLALSGLWLLVGVDVSALPPGVLLGVGLGLGTALWYALYILGVRKSQERAHKLPPVTNMAWLSLSTAFFTGLTGVARGAEFTVGESSGMLILLIYGIGPQALGWLLISTGLPGFRASVAGLLILIQPTLAFIWDIWFFQRPAGWVSLAGAGLALGAIYMGSIGGEPKKAPPK